MSEIVKSKAMWDNFLKIHLLSFKNSRKHPVSGRKGLKIALSAPQTGRRAIDFYFKN